MRTTIDIPAELHRRVKSIAHDTSRTLSETVTDLLERGLGDGRSTELKRSERTGLPLIRLGRVITTEDVRSLDDDE